MKKTNRFLVLLTAFFLSVSFPCFGLVYGTVTDAFKNPVSGASVVFTSESDSSQSWSAVTDVTGKYQINIFTSVLDNSHLPQSFLLKQNYPNPFNPTTIIPFTLSKPNNCILWIYNVQGQKVRTLIDGYFSTGGHSVIWNGLDDRNRPSSAGIYFYRMQVGGKSETKKMLLLEGGVPDNYRGISAINKPEKSGKTALATYRVTITGNDIVQYKNIGLVIIDAGTYDFKVIRINQYQGITFVSIPGGTFQMGDEIGDLWNTCIPVHTVTVSSFQMSEWEITNVQYAKYLNEALATGDITADSVRVKGLKGSYNGREYMYLSGLSPVDSDARCWIKYAKGAFLVESGKENYPVIWVSWYGAKAFALYNRLDLATEAEWEYACRAGRNYLYGTDDGTLSASKVNFWDNGIHHPVNVGSYPRNPFGIYDMSGNVWEWCNDWYGSYSAESVSNPTGAFSGTYRVLRGGGWFGTVSGCRSAFRYYYVPDEGDDDIGFHVVRHVSQ
jgi:formylglycine-generating enzyme required for sulfatase activity